jgi:hypothetical protein
MPRGKRQGMVERRAGRGSVMPGATKKSKSRDGAFLRKDFADPEFSVGENVRVAGRLFETPYSTEPSGMPDEFRVKLAPSQQRKHELIRGTAARRVRTAGADITTGTVPIHRLDRMTAHGEGELEIDFLTVVDFDWEDLETLVAQPDDNVALRYHGKVHRWVPDFLICRRGSRDMLAEVKPASKVHIDPKKFPEKAAVMKARIAAMRQRCHELGMDFGLFTELEVRLEPRFHNANAMYRAMTSHIPLEVVDAAEETLVELPKHFVVTDLFPYLGEFRYSTLNVCCLLDRRGAIRLSREHFFSPMTPVTNLSIGGNR